MNENKFGEQEPSSRYSDFFTLRWKYDKKNLYRLRDFMLFHVGYTIEICVLTLAAVHLKTQIVTSFTEKKVKFFL